MASNNPADYINPIISAFVRSQQRADMLKQQQFENEQQQKQMQLRERQTALFEKEAADNLKRRDEMLKLEQQVQRITERDRGLDAIKKVGEMSRQGVDVKKLFRQPAVENFQGQSGEMFTVPGTPEGQLTIPNYGNVNEGTFMSPEEQIAWLEQQEAAKSEGRAVGRISEIDARTKGQRGLLDTRLDSQMIRDAMRIQSQEDLTDKKLKTQKEIADARNSAMLEGVNRRVAGMNTRRQDITDVAQIHADDLLNFRTTIDKIPKDQKAPALLKLKEMGYVQPNPKVGGNLQAFAPLRGGITILEQIIPLLGTGSVSATATGYKRKLGDKFGVSTNLGNLFKQLEAHAGPFARASILGADKGALALKDIDRALGALAEDNLTQEQAKQRYEQLKKDIEWNFNQILKAHNFPEEQKQYYRELFGGSIFPQKGELPQGVPPGSVLDMEATIKAGQPVYRKDDE